MSITHIANHHCLHFPANTITIFAGLNCANSFLERCITFVGENAAECVKTNAFMNLTKEGLIKLISSDYVRHIKQPK